MSQQSESSREQPDNIVTVEKQKQDDWSSEDSQTDSSGSSIDES